jgi:hypothetical protein
MSGLDAIREAMALIRMTLDQYDKDISERIARLAEHADVSPEDIREVDDTPDEHHWQLGSPRNLVNSRFAMQEAIWISTSTRRSFDTNLRSFIRNTFPDEPLREDGEDIITVRCKSWLGFLFQPCGGSADPAVPVHLYPLHITRGLDRQMRCAAL